MYIKLHGGDCCGIKHIHELSTIPTMKISARKAICSADDTSFGQDWGNGHNDMVSINSKPTADFFNDEAPQEKYHERLKRLVDFITNNRAHGLIEVVLEVGEQDDGGQDAWIPYLEKLNFKKVSEFENSNSCATVAVWHLAH